MAVESGPIQLQPRGLLAFLQLKNQGRNPANLVDSIQPTFDILDWYQQANDRYVFAQGQEVGLSTTGSVQMDTAFDQDVWLLEYTVRAQPTPGAGEFRALCAYQPGNNSGVEIALGDSPSVFNAGEVFVARAELPRPLLLRAGSLLSIIRLVNGQAGSFDAFAYYRYSPVDQG